MPIKITDKNNEEIAWLCDEAWELPDQVEALANWLNTDGKNLSKGDYAADIGYGPRQGAAGGGCSISPSAMQSMLSIGMTLYLSEYPIDNDE